MTNEENQLSSARNIEIQSHPNQSSKNNPTHNNRPKLLLLIKC